MGQIRRRLFAIVSVLSLICFLATVGLWVRSYWVSDEWQRHASLRMFEVHTSPGRVMLFGGPPHYPRPDGWYHQTNAAVDDGGVMFRVADLGARGLMVLFPHSLATLLFALAPTYWLFGPRRRVRRRRRLGLCLN